MYCQAADVVDDLVLIAPHAEIAHHIPGRIRLRIKPSGLAIIRRTNVQDLMGNIPGIKSIRINSIIGSVLIEYDKQRLPFSFWESLKELRNRPELVTELKGQLEAVWE